MPLLHPVSYITVALLPAAQGHTTHVCIEYGTFLRSYHVTPGRETAFSLNSTEGRMGTRTDIDVIAPVVNRSPVA